MSWMPAPGVRVLALPRVIGLVIAVALTALVAGFGAGWRVHGWRVANVTLKAERKLELAEENERGRQHAIAGRVTEEEQTIHQDFERGRHALDEHVAAHPDLRACDIGADGLRLWNGWNAGRGVPDTGGVADGAGAGAAAGPERDAAGPHGQPP